MFRAIWRFFRAIGYLLTGRIDAAREELSKSPHVIRATYEDIIRQKTGRITEFRSAISGLIVQEEKKKQSLKILTGEVTQLENLKTGAMVKAKKRVAVLQGQDKTAEEIQKDAEYVQCQGAFRDFSSTLEEKKKRIAELEADISTLSSTIGSHKVQLQQLMREIDKLRTEASDAVAEMISAQEERAINDMLAGISEDKTTEELQRMRDLRQKEKAKARVAREMAGTDTKVQEAEFLKYAQTTEQDSEFAKLVGLAKEADTPPVVGAEKKEEASPLPQ